ncbi:alpha-hydroxy acid oxidase [Geodermatophilus sabuli]|uniref:L-lactate dehydrogenase (Cytochrome)/(S)-mandelate dehydrogenase n=1 Tax=Geodermatophilus sabuli TaxID=1564158 RepID=A0A285E7U9_9ACTN|nr:alpha-hydroxy acid oxidase [Geodermatophilus sabuli]MBB3082041.1 isopentenyl diphosphate isomerase/L-lactate dehydrogenase-like FMN-dependent dehydrogenase [Geodermatophilus sabuli]SNX95087.1 L-lactate dehydrogenase (cytochrome)/(S)-mandelate dehydrogenase [Geodermatophilus sabuli]
MRLRSAVNLADVREAARRRLPRPVFDMIDGGADDELTLARNEAAFREIRLRPRVLADVSAVDPAVELFGRRVSLPVLLAPTGGGRIAHRRAELAVAAAAAAQDTVYVQSTVTGYPLEEVSRAGGGGLWYQLYLPSTREETRTALDRVAAAGYRVLVLTVDTPVFGGRERDRRNGFGLPVRPTPGMLLHGASRPAWAVEFLRGNLPTRRDGRLSAWATQRQILASPRPVTWADLAFVRGLWDGPLVVKGVLRSEEVPRLLDSGADGVVVSNHGGRQLDGVQATVEALPAVVDAVAGRVPVLLDGGVRRGTDVLKALALGATAVLVGRPYLYGLAAGGQAGVEHVLELLRAELLRAMALTGSRTPGDVDRGLLLLPGG